MERTELLNDNEEAMREILEGHQVGLWTALPGIVQSVDLTAMTCEVQPSLQAVVTNLNGVDSVVNLPLLVDVPIVFPSAGGFTITLPIAAGDEVLVVFSARCIDAWWQSGGVQQAMEARMHDLSDGFAIPGPRSLPRKVPAISSTALQIRNDAGTTYLELSADGKVKIVTPSEIDITGDINVTGTIHATGDVLAGSVSLKNHEHPFTVPSTPFSGETGAPS